MEILGFSIVCSIFAFIGSRFKKITTTTIIKDVIESAGGEALEELVEKVVMTLFPKLMPFIPFTRMRKQRVLFAEQVKDALQSLNEEEVRELKSFFESHAIDGKRLKELSGIDLNDPKTLASYVKALKSQLKANREELTKGFALESGEAMVRKMYGITAPDAQIPAALLKLSDLISRRVSEIMYLGLSSDDRDLAKVIQLMMADNNKRITADVREMMEKTLVADVRAMMQDTLAIILQHHEDGTLAALPAMATVNKEKGIPSDPYFYVKLVCPECGATADYVHRHGDRVFCRCCGGSYDIVQNAEPEVVARIAELEARLEARLTANGVEIGAQVCAQLHEMAEKTVSAEYFERQMNALKNGTEAVALTVEQMEEALSQRMASIERYLEDMRRQAEARDMDFRAWSTENARELQAGLTATIVQENRNLQMQLLRVQEDLARIGTDTSETREMVGRLIKLIGTGAALDAETLQRLGDQLDRIEAQFMAHTTRRGGPPNEDGRVHGVRHRRTCPVCNAYETFRHSHGEYQCPVCGAVFNSASDEAPGRPPVPVEMKITNGKARLRATLNSTEGYDSGTVSIRLRYADMDRLEDARIESRELTGRNIRPTQVILRADSNCYFAFAGHGNLRVLSPLLSALRRGNPGLRRLVLGENIQLILPGNEKGFLDGSFGRWKQDAKHPNVFLLDCSSRT